MDTSSLLWNRKAIFNTFDMCCSRVSSGSNMNDSPVAFRSNDWVRVKKIKVTVHEGFSVSATRRVVSLSVGQSVQIGPISFTAGSLHFH